MFRLGSKAFSAWLNDVLIERIKGEDDWVAARTGIYQVPVGWFLKGLVAAHSSDGFYVYAYTYPLLAHAPDFVDLSYSRRVLRPGASTFPLPAKDTAEAVADMVAEVWRAQRADKLFEERATPEGFLEYVEGYRKNAPNQDLEADERSIPAGACYLLLGNEDEARRELSDVPTRPTQDHPQHDVDLARELLHCLSDGGVAAAMVRLASVRDAALAAQLKAF